VSAMRRFGCRSSTPPKMRCQTAARCYGFDLEVLRTIGERIGPTPSDLGQDVTRVTTPEELRRAEWWKDEYHTIWGG
jgi:hypothetical protein